MLTMRQALFTSSALSIALSIAPLQAALAGGYQYPAEPGHSAHSLLRAITDKAQKQLVLQVPDKALRVDVDAGTAYSAVTQVAQKAGYRVHYADDTFTILPAAAQDVEQVAKSGASGRRAAPNTFSLTLRDTPVKEAFEMLAKRGRQNLILAPNLSGNVSANLYDVDLDTAIDNVARAAGLSVSRAGASIYIDGAAGPASAALQKPAQQVESFKVQYSDVSSVEEILRDYLSEDGSLTALAARRLLIVRDTPAVIEQMRQLLQKVDMQPRQILIEAKILEITLNEDETFGIDWQATRGDGKFGTLELAKRETSGLFMNLVSSDLNAYLAALSTTGRVRTLSTPKLLVLEDQEASVTVGDKLGFRVVSISDNTTVESVEFLESGIILRVNAAVDGQERILLDVHPEVSNGSLVDGLPVQKTTEVTTHLLAESGDEVFIGGLLRTTETDNESGVPKVSKVPWVGNLFKKTEDKLTRTETVVIIKPRLVENTREETDPLAAMIESDSWFYDTIPPIEIAAGCFNGRCAH